MVKLRHGLVFATVVGSLVLSATHAQAYVRAVTETGVPTWWRNPCITMQLYLGENPLPPTMTADQYINAARLAGRAWSYPALTCTDLSITVQKESQATAEVGLDLKNVIVFRQDAWCENSDASEGPCYPPNALAVTTVFKSTTTGEIVDADLELNAVSISWADLVADPALAENSNTADLQNTLTHEFGHVIGLAHPCYSPNDGPAVLDDNTGNPEPDCSNPNLPLSVTEATMYPVVPMSDTQRRTLSPDDEQAVCDIYPYTFATCPAGSAQGCAMVAPTKDRPSRNWALGLVAGMAGLLLAFAFRRSRL
jgi:hypothetical protein